MNGPKEAKPGTCGAAGTAWSSLSIGDDYGDNSCTFRCEKPPGHTGAHLDQFLHDGVNVVVKWHRVRQGGA